MDCEIRTKMHVIQQTHRETWNGMIDLDEAFLGPLPEFLTAFLLPNSS